MTTIACNREEMYGDRQFTHHGSGNKFKGTTKVYSFKAHKDSYPEDFIIGFAGTASDIVTVVSYFTCPEHYKNPPKVTGLGGLVLTASQNIFMFDNYQKWLAVDQPYYAIGSGGLYALGALASGASPKEAVKVAMQHDAFSGMGIKGIRLKF